MALRRKRNEQNGVKDGSWGYSQESLAELERGVYGRTTNRKARYNSSSEQTRQAHELPALEGMASKEIWESNYGKNRKSPNTVDTRSARRKYEQRVGHFGEDARNLRNQGYGSSYTNIDFSGISKIDEDALDAALKRRENEKKFSTLNTPSDEDRMAEAQSYIDKYGHSKEDVLNAYEIYKASKEREARETTPFWAGLKDFRSAPDRGIANAVKYLGHNFLPDSDIEKAGDWLREKTGANEVEKQRNYSRESTKIGNVKKALLDPYFQYGDLASSELAAALLSGGAMADPASGFGMMFEGNPLLKGAMRYGSGYGLTADEKYNQLVKQGVDEEEASRLANVSGLSMAAAQAAGKLIPSLGASAPLAQRLLTNGGLNATIMAGRQGLEEIADTLIRNNQSEYNQSVQKHIAEGMTPEKADSTAKMEILSRLGGAGLFGFLMGAGSELAGNGLSKAASKAAGSVDDTLNSVWATQQALPQNDIPQLTGTVDSTQALTGSTYNVPALVDNIYPIQMPGTQGVIPMPGTNGVIAPVIGGESAPVDVPVEVNPDDVIYHSGILSRLNKADSAGKMQGSRDTGYYGTGHYFVDQAHKSQIGKGSGYADKPYTSVDISKYNNLFRADTDAKASELHDFSQKMMRYINGRNDRYYTTDGEIDPLAQENYILDMYAEYLDLFPADNHLSLPEFKNRLGQFRDEYEYDFYDRGDSAFTTFMKEHGYNGVDTRGTNSANTERGVVIYDLDEDSILQSNVTDEAVKNGLMNTRVRNGQPLFDEETDARIQNEIDATNKRKQIKQEYRKLYDESKLKKIDKEIEKTKERINRLENDIIPYEQLKADKDPEQFEIEYKQFRRVDPDITKEEFANIFYDNSFEDGDPLVNSKTELALMKGKLEELEKAYASEEKLSEAAYKQAKNTVNGVIPEEDLDAAVAQSVSESLVPEVKNVSAKAKTKKVEAQKANVPAVTNEPNFSLVGGSYTPKEVPNVQPTPPSNNVPPNNVPPGDGPDNGGEMKTSQYYKNTMRGTETNRDMSDEEYAKRFDEEIYKRMTIPEQQSVSMGQRFIDESGSEEAAIQRLLSGDFDSEERFSGYHIDAAEMLANNIERQALELEAQGQDASQLWRTANKLHKKIQLNASDFGVGLQALQKWKKSTPQGAFDDLISQVNKGIDQKKTTGYTRSINSLSDKIVDAVENSDSKAGLIDKIKSIFAEDRKNNPYNTQKAEQQVLDLVGGDKNTKMSITDLADEAGKVIKKQMGVSSLTPKEERAILNLLDAASQLEPGTRAYNELVSQAMIIVDESLPASAGEKFKSLLYDNMLASIKTMFTRNFGGNVVGNAIDAMAAPFQVGADAIVGKFTGERTRTLTGKSIVAAAKGLGHGFKDWGQDIGYSLKNKTLLNTARSGQESLADVLHAVHKTWKTQSNNKAVKGIHNALATYDYIIRKGMEGGDRPIYEAQYAATQAELYHLVKKYGDAGLRKGLPADKRDVDTDDLIDMIAINEALEAVLQNDSKMKEAAKNIKAFFRKASEDMVGIDIASMSHAPFVEVPANMASNFFKLTPVGWVGNINRTIGEKRKYGSINQRRFTGELGLNVLGGLMGAGLFGVANKIISDKYSEDKDEKKLQQNNGYQEYALQAPDESWQADISDIPYLGAMMKYAKMERDAYNEDGLKGALSALGSSIGAATVDTLYQSLNRLTGADFQYNGSGNLVGNAINNIKSSVGSMGVPSWLRQTAQFTDPYKRDLGDYGSDEYNKNLIINGIPGLRQTMLDPKIDTAGQPVPELGGATGFNRFMSAYINPWKISHPHENTSAVQEYANMLKQATEGKVNPQMKVVNKSDITKIKGYDAENYSHKDLREFQEEYYKSNTEYGNALINDPWFTNLSYEKQGELLDELWKANKALCQENFVRKGKTPEEIEAAGDELYTTDNKLAGILRDDDENHTGLIQWLKDETARDEMNEKYGTNMSHDKFVDFNSRGEGYAEQRASETEIAKSLGMTVDSYEKYEAEYEGGAQAYHDDREAAKQYGFVNANKVANIDAYNVAKELGNGDPNVIQAYSDYKKQGIKSNSYGAKANYLEDEDRLTDQQKGMVIAGSQDGSKIGNLAKGAQELYRMGGDDYSGVYYYYLLKNMADADGSGSVTKKEREAFFANDNPYLDDLWQLNQDMYNYLMTNLK